MARRKTKRPPPTDLEALICEGKRAYRKLVEAKRQESFSRRILRRTVAAYRCPVCRNWHLGHNRDRQPGPPSNRVTLGAGGRDGFIPGL